MSSEKLTGINEPISCGRLNKSLKGKKVKEEAISPCKTPLTKTGNFACVECGLTHPLSALGNKRGAGKNSLTCVTCEEKSKNKRPQNTEHNAKNYRIGKLPPFCFR